jgi:oxygen-independent coproporphyrinogen-3 oxidase
MSFSIYVHVPFCLTRCNYCAFYSGEPLGLLEGYEDLVCAEIEFRQRVEPGPRPAATLYFGGGTPSLLGARGVGRIVEAVDRAWGLESGAEVSLEANPTTSVDFEGLREAGITRVSVGVQCLDDALLASLGRSHSAAEARTTVRRAVKAHFASVGADLLFGLPGLKTEDLRMWVRELADAGVTHVSAYSLETPPGTPLERSIACGAFCPVDPAAEDAQWEALASALEAAEYGSYEVSNFARPGFRCRHNLAYWNGSPYLGLGPGAHGFAPTAGAWGSRSWNDPGIGGYAEHLRCGLLPPGDSELLTPEQALLEDLFLALRRPEPIDPAEFCRAHGVARDSFDASFAVLQDQGYVSTGAEDEYTPTMGGICRADGLAVWVQGRLAPRPQQRAGLTPQGGVVTVPP